MFRVTGDTRRVERIKKKKNNKLRNFGFCNNVRVIYTEHDADSAGFTIRPCDVTSCRRIVISRSVITIYERVDTINIFRVYYTHNE